MLVCYSLCIDFYFYYYKADFLRHWKNNLDNSIHTNSGGVASSDATKSICGESGHEHNTKMGMLANLDWTWSLKDFRSDHKKTFSACCCFGSCTKTLYLC